MAVLYVVELWPNRGGEDNIQRKRTHTRYFEVRTDNTNDDDNTVGAATGIPRLGAWHPNDPFTWVIKNQPKQSEDDPTLWYVTIGYGTELPARVQQTSQQVDDNGASEAGDTAKDPSSLPENPLDQQPVFKVDYEQATEVCEEDWQGNPILNSAGDPYDPPLEKEVSYHVLTVTFNVAGINFDLLDNYDDAINNAPWKGRAAFTWRVVTIGYESAMTNGQSYWKVMMRFKYKSKTWLRKVIDRGFRELGGDGKPVRIQDLKNGGFPTEPQLLDGNGHALTPGNAPVFRTFHIFPEKNFTLLGI